MILFPAIILHLFSNLAFLILVSREPGWRRIVAGTTWLLLSTLSLSAAFAAGWTFN